MKNLFNKEISEVIDFCKANQPTLVIGMPEFGKSKIFLPNLQNHLKQELKDSTVLLVMPNILQNISYVIVQNISDSSIRNVPLSRLGSLINEYLKIGQKVLVIINSGENVEKDLELMTLCKQLGHNTNYNWIFIGYTPIYSQLKYSQDPFAFLSACVVALVPMSFSESTIYLEHLVTTFNIKLSRDQIKQVIEVSGGNPGLIKGMVQNMKLDMEIDSINDQRINTRITHILNGLTAEQYKCFLDIISGKNPEHDENYQFLCDFGYMNADGRPFSPLVVKHLESLTQDIKARMVDGLTVIEEKIYKLLLSNKGEIVSRDQLANEIWGRDRLNKYSDYVIDKHISNIRKILKERSDTSSIETFKKRGFKYQINPIM